MERARKVCGTDVIQEVDSVNAIDQMRDEHGGIKEMLRILDKFCERLENGEAADLDDGAAMIEFLQVYADKFHHEKEERLIFPLLEKLGVPRTGGPIEILLEDHDQGRAYVRGMAEALECLRAGDGEAVRSFAEHARNYIRLLTEHIEVEDEAIFDMAEMRLSAAQLEQLAAEFATVEKVNLVAGKNEALHILLERLKGVYLS
jgi:hemerythrin-like domain-containing protein